MIRMIKSKYAIDEHESLHQYEKEATFTITVHQYIPIMLEDVYL